MSAGFTREDMQDAIAEAISDSMELDWDSSIGAAAVMRECGVWELYEALERFCLHMELSHWAGSTSLALEGRAILAKARAAHGETL